MNGILNSGESLINHAKIQLGIDHVSSIFNAEATTILEALELLNDQQMKNCTVS